MSQSHMALYRSVWRRHFYAGIFVAPFLLILAVTGAIYLFNDEINDALHPEKRFATVVGKPVALSKVAEDALAGFPGGTVTRIDTPTSPERTYQVFVTPSVGEPVRVFVEPATGRVLGHFIYPNTLVGIADRLHGSLMMGDFGDAIVELAACWGLILTATGLYLWWPRGRVLLHQAFVPKLEARGRRLWKSLHAVVGFWTAFLMVFLILSGLPWATVWGAFLRQTTEFAGFGYPASYRAHGAPVSTSLTVKDVTDKAAPWTIEGMPAPLSDPHAGHHDHGHSSVPDGAPPIALDEVAAIIAANGMHDPYRLSFPNGATGVYSAFTYPDQPEGQRTFYIDQYSGRVIGDIGFQDYGIAAKAVELDVQIHMGNYFGRLNQIVMLIPCIGIIILSITGPYMWWLRRPKGAFGAPKALTQPAMRTLTLIVCTLGLLFPLAGASLIVVLLLDGLIQWSLGTAGALQPSKAFSALLFKSTNRATGAPTRPITAFK